MEKYGAFVNKDCIPSTKCSYNKREKHIFCLHFQGAISERTHQFMLAFVEKK